MRSVVALLVVAGLAGCGGAVQGSECATCEEGGTRDVAPEPEASLIGIDATAGMDATIGVDATTGWDPSMVPGLAIWFNDEVGVGHDGLMPDGLVGWKDDSFNGNWATAVGSGLVIEPGAANGHDAFRCNATGLQVPASKTLAWGTNDFWLAAVMRWPSDAMVTVYARSNEPFSLGITMGTVQVRDGSQVASNAPQNFGSFHWILAKGRTLSVAIDGVAKSGPVGDWDASALVPLQVCTGMAELAELIGARGTLSASDEAGLASYFKTKFNL